MYDGTLKFDTKIDESGYDVGLDKLGSIAKSGLSAISGMASAAVSALGGLVSSAVSGLVSFGEQAVQTGMEFQSAVSQIGATLGYSIAEINNPATEAYQNMQMLSDKAEEMGAKTSFSATQAAEGLNILAMSGYSATESMQMIDSVLDMAAAGSLDLASAASYVAGSMKGFTKEAGNFADNAEASAYYGDLIAKGATLANTNVQQLGEAMSQASSSADSYSQSSTEAGVALLRLAEQNTVGSAAATALGAAMKELYTPTEQAKKALDSLGVSAYDAATGAAKSFNATVDELGNALRQISDESERNALENAIFGEQGKRAFDQMLASSSEKVQSFYDGLANASGSAHQQAETMLDNLAGDITIFGSALDGLKIKVSDAFDAPFREIVQEATKYLSELTEITKNQGLEGLASALGSKVAEAFDFLSGYIPKASEIGLKLVSSLAKGFIKNTPSMLKTAGKTGLEIAKNIVRSAPDFIQAGRDVLSGLSKGLTENHAQLYQKLRTIGHNLIKSLADSVTTGIPDLVNTALNLVQFVVDALTDSKNLAGIVGGAVTLLTALADGLIQSVPFLIEKVPEIVSSLERALKDNADLISESGHKILEKLGESLKNAKETLKEKAPEIMQNIISAIENAPLSVASVADSVITAIADALGVEKEWELVKKKIKNSLKGLNLDTLKMNLEIAFKGVPAKVKQEFETVSETFKESADRLKKSFDNLKGSMTNLRNAFQPLTNKLKEYVTSGEAGENAGTVLETAISGVSAAVSVAADAISRLLSGVMDFVAWATGETDGAHAFQEAILGVVTAIGTFAGMLGIMTAVQHFMTFLQFGLPVMLANLPNLLAGVSGTFSGLFGVIAANPIVALIAVLAGLVAMLVHVAQTSEEWQIGAQMIVDWMEEVKENWRIGIGEIGDWIGKLIQWFKDVGEGLGFMAKEADDKIQEIIGFFEGYGEYMYDLVDSAVSWGSDMIQNFIDGINQMWNDAKQVVSDFAQMIENFLGFSEPEKGALSNFHTYAPDMMALFADGIRQKQKFVLTQAETLAENLSSVFSNPLEVGEAVLNGEISMPQLPEPEKQMFKFATSEIHEIAFEVQDMPEIQSPEIVLDFPEMPEFESPEILFSSDIPEISLKMPDIPELYFDSPELPEIQNPEIPLDVPELPEIQNQEILLMIPEIPEIQAPEIILETPVIPELYFSSPELPEIQNPEITLISPEIPEIKNPEIPEISPAEIGLKLMQLPSDAFTSSELPEMKNPEISFDLPNVPEIIQIQIDEKALQALQNAELSVMQNSAKTSPVTEMISHHYYQTTNQNTVQNLPAEKKSSELTIYSVIEMNDQTFGTAVKKVILDENALSGGGFI